MSGLVMEQARPPRRHLVFLLHDFKQSYKLSFDLLSPDIYLAPFVNPFSTLTFFPSYEEYCSELHNAAFSLLEEEQLREEEEQLRQAEAQRQHLLRQEEAKLRQAEAQRQHLLRQEEAKLRQAEAQRQHLLRQSKARKDPQQAEANRRG